MNMPEESEKCATVLKRHVLFLLCENKREALNLVFALFDDSFDCAPREISFSISAL